MSSDAKIILVTITAGITLGGFAICSINMRLDRIEADIWELRSLHQMAKQKTNETSPSTSADQPAATAKD